MKIAKVKNVRVDASSKVAELDVNGQTQELIVYAKSPKHFNTYRNVVPHGDWVRTGMEVELHEDWEGIYISPRDYHYVRIL